MELRKLRHFLAVLDAGSLADAARRVHISQPALSKSIHALEKLIGSPLFVRSARGMVPTASARAIELRARIISAEVDRAQSEVREIQSATRGRITIGTGPSFGQAILPRALGRLMQTSPNVEIVILDGFVDTLLPAVESGAIEFALLTLTPQIPTKEVETEVLVPNDRTLVVANSRNPLVSRRSIPIEAVWSGPWALVRDPDQLRRKLTELFSRANLPPPRPSVEFSSVSLALGALRESNLISFLPEILVKPHIDAGALRALQMTELTWERSLGVVYRRGSSLTPVAEKLLAEIRSICGRKSAKHRPSRS